MLSACKRTALWVAGAALVLMSACKAYDADRLGEPPASGAGQGGGTGGGGSGAGGSVGDGGSAGTGTGTGDGGMCVEQPYEACNLLDDDCDGDVDEETATACEAIVVHALTDCVLSRGRMRCIKVECHDGFIDADGQPSNGCEVAVDDGDGGSEDDAGS